MLFMVWWCDRLISVFIDDMKSVIAKALSLGILHKRSAYAGGNPLVIRFICLSNRESTWLSLVFLLTFNRFHSLWILINWYSIPLYNLVNLVHALDVVHWYWHPFTLKEYSPSWSYCFWLDSPDKQCLFTVASQNCNMLTMRIWLYLLLQTSCSCPFIVHIAGLLMFLTLFNIWVQSFSSY